MKALKVLAIGVVVGGISLAVGTQAHAEAWTPRTVDQIKADIAKTNGKEYTIVWGDTLSGISQATNITVQKLADMNKITNVDLIYAGNKLIFEGSVVSVENGKGDTVAQTVIQPEDKVDPKKSVGQPVQGKDTTSNKKADNKTDKNATADSKADTKKADVKSDGSASENGKQVDLTPGENKDGSAEIPSQPANNANQNDVAGGSSNQGQTTPDTPANNSSETQKSAVTTTESVEGMYKYITAGPFNTEDEATMWMINSGLKVPQGGNIQYITRPDGKINIKFITAVLTNGGAGENSSTTQSTQPSQSDSGNGGTATSKFYVGQVLYSKSFATTAEADAHAVSILDKWYAYGDANNLTLDISWAGGGPYTVKVVVEAVN
ncbi:LysM peptidoglycan-binding domain-containing protein [Enterococcus casseliflavus]|uniref:LysM peptidoglycan-binding domain-containing protein n=1 Tax=Enterococcus casseliflavus TaxID=37734 RepID=UPI002DB7B6B7|nr:LysM peptidoglycan-binding domain-containing protein [Enterococcus casseliflavus]MEB8419058.1 LysM peptidoglycan-binding domain-containing protein [Enterococcus casseliflavus]